MGGKSKGGGIGGAFKGGGALGGAIGAGAGAVLGGPAGAIIGGGLGAFQGKIKPGGGGYNTGPSVARAKAPTFNAIIDKKGNLGKNYQSQFNYEAIEANPNAMKALRKEALRAPGSQSAWLNLALQKQQMEQAGLGDQAAAMQAGQLAQARSQLASRGGLGGGAAERLAGSGAREQMLERQRIAREGASSRLGLQSQDEDRRLDLLKQMPGMELQWLQPKVQQAQYKTSGQAAAQDANIQRALQELGNQRAFKEGRYQDAMKEWATSQQAGALAKQGERQGPAKWFHGLPGFG